ncbi:MAG: hypothetical protein ABI397_03440 [Candidatus Saccharimonas sp.]
MKTEQYNELLSKIKQNAKTPADAAATWWTGLVNDDEAYIGDSDRGTRLKLSSLLPSMLPSGGLMIFAGAMVTKLNRLLSDSSGRIDLVVDDGPDDFLKDCARQAGIAPGRFNWPPNTRMRVSPNRVLLEYNRSGLNAIWDDGS